MNITSTTTTKNAEEITDKARFHIDYTITDGRLIRAQFNVYDFGATSDSAEEDSAENKKNDYVGAIYFDSGHYSCHLPVDSDVSYYFSQVETYMKSILKTTEGIETATGLTASGHPVASR